jgi:hypothetical protein
MLTIWRGQAWGAAGAACVSGARRWPVAPAQQGLTLGAGLRSRGKPTLASRSTIAASAFSSAAFRASSCRRASATSDARAAAAASRPDSRDCRPSRAASALASSSWGRDGGESGQCRGTTTVRPGWAPLAALGRPPSPLRPGTHLRVREPRVRVRPPRRVLGRGRLGSGLQRLAARLPLADLPDRARPLAQQVPAERPAGGGDLGAGNDGLPARPCRPQARAPLPALCCWHKAGGARSPRPRPLMNGASLELPDDRHHRLHLLGGLHAPRERHLALQRVRHAHAGARADFRPGLLAGRGARGRRGGRRRRGHGRRHRRAAGERGPAQRRRRAPARGRRGPARRRRGAARGARGPARGARGALGGGGLGGRSRGALCLGQRIERGAAALARDRVGLGFRRSLGGRGVACPVRCRRAAVRPAAARALPRALRARARRTLSPSGALPAPASAAGGAAAGASRGMRLSRRRDSICGAWVRAGRWAAS